MKKFLVLLLALLLAVCPLALADEIADVQVDVDFDGEWWDIREYGFSIYLPSAWDDITSGDADFAAGPADGSVMMQMDFVAYESATTLDALYDELHQREGYENVAMMKFNEYLFVTYDYPANNVFGAAALTDDSKTAVLFKFTPDDDETALLATKIMVSLVEIDVSAADEEWGEEDEEDAAADVEFSEEDEESDVE